MFIIFITRALSIRVIISTLDAAFSNMDNDLKYKIGLTLIDSIGDLTAKKLIAYCGGVEAVFREKRSALLKIPNIGQAAAEAVLTQNVLSQAEQEIAFIQKRNINALFFLDAEYPERLKYCDDSPVMLYCAGKMDLNRQRTVSIVGTRSATPHGKKFCEDLVEQLKNRNVSIISGLAYGIDITAHKAAVKHGIETCAVVAHGHDRVYPALHSGVLDKMYENGGLVTEFVSGTNPDRENFPKRNRIIAGLSDAVVVIESAKKGGSLITAEIANSYNRDVFAVPGRLSDEYSKGCNWLIKSNKAVLLESTKDLEYIMGWEEKGQKPGAQKQLFLTLKPEERILVDLLSEQKLGIDMLCLKSQLSTSKVAATLTNLEFSGIVTCLPGKVFQLN